MIKLLTVIGHGTSLLPHFIKHYQNQVDEINIAVYETDLHPTLGDEISELIKDYDNVNISIVIKERLYDWEKVTQLYNFIKMKNQGEWFVIADIDEFHLYPNNNLRELISDCEKNNWDIVRGGFIDRIGRGGEFTELTNEQSIWEQFPNAGFFRYPMSKACPNKICVMKGYIEVTSGQHYAKIDGHTTWKWQGWNHPLINPNDHVQVHHFKWDKTCVDRIKAVVDVNQDYAYSNEYSIMFLSLRKNRFKIDVNHKDYMIEHSYGEPEFKRYKQWNKLIKKIISI